MMTFDMNTQIITDFTQDKRQILQGINSLVIPGFRETNVFDALNEGWTGCRGGGAQIHHPDLQRTGHVLEADVRQDSEDREASQTLRFYGFNGRDGA